MSMPVLVDWQRLTHIITVWTLWYTLEDLLEVIDDMDVGRERERERESGNFMLTTRLDFRLWRSVLKLRDVICV